MVRALHHLDGVSAPERYHIGLVLDQLPEITAWRDGLPEAKQRALNSPSATWFAWRRSCGEKKAPKEKPAPFEKQLTEARATKKPLYWPQDALRRAHEAMLKSQSSDLRVLARAALQAAVRCEADLLAILEHPPAVARPHERVAEPAL